MGQSFLDIAMGGWCIFIALQPYSVGINFSNKLVPYFSLPLQLKPCYKHCYNFHLSSSTFHCMLHLLSFLHLLAIPWMCSTFHSSITAHVSKSSSLYPDFPFLQTRMESTTVQPFPENLAELMKSGNAPNVTLQVSLFLVLTHKTLVCVCVLSLSWW